MGASWIDRAIEAVAPDMALRRLQARLAHSALAAYDGAKVSRRTRGWNASSTSATTEARDALPRLRDRARDLVRNNPYAAAGLDLKVAYEVGTGIIPRSATGDAALDEQADAAFDAWAETTGYYALQAMVARTRAESGEALVQLTDLSAATARARGLVVPLALTALEPDYLNAWQEASTPDGGIISGGIELGPDGLVRAYHLFDRHPGDAWGMLQLRGVVSRRVTTEDLLHIFRADRPGQLRGVSDFAPVMMRLRSLDEYEDALLEQAKVQACLAVFVTTGAEAAKAPLAGTRDPETGQVRRSLSPGMIERLRPGDTVTTVSPPNPNATSYKRDHLLAIATGIGLTYDLLTGDLTGANYSSLRAGRLAFRRRLEATQWHVLIPGFCTPTYARWARQAQRAGVLPFRDSPWPVVWNPPQFEMLDPAAEFGAAKDGIRSGLLTWDAAVSQTGNDPRKQLAAIAATNKALDAAGIILDCDPRRIAAAAGSAQDAKQNARVQIAATGPA
jgi:lambda family phage portal protein